jgi:hypothetical protein
MNKLEIIALALIILGALFLGAAFLLISKTLWTIAWGCFLLGFVGSMVSVEIE